MEPATGRWTTIARPSALVGLLLLAMLPTLAAAWRHGDDWIAVSDQAAITMRARDVLSWDPPLVGMPTSLGHSVGEPVYHPGPMGFWPVAAIQVLVHHPSAPMIGAALVNLVCIAGIVLIAHRLGGRRGALVTAAGLVVVTWSLRDDALVDPWNPYAGLVPFGLYLAAVLGWLSGLRWAGLVAVVAGSYVVQSHLTLVMPALAFLLAAIAITWPRARDRLTVMPLRELIVTGVGAAACWALPLLDLTVGHRNLWHLVRASGAGGDTLGVGAAWELVARSVVTPPWRVDHLIGQEIIIDSDPLVIVAGTAILLGALVLAVVVRHRGAAISALLAGSVAGLLAGGLAASRIPLGFFNLYALHNYLWTWTLSAALWVGVVLALGRLLRDAREPWGRLLGLGGVAVVLLAAVVLSASALRGPSDRSSYVAQYGSATRGLADGLADKLERGSTYLVDVPDDIVRSMIPMGLAAELERRGFDVVVPDMLSSMVGDRRVGGDPLAVLRVEVGLDIDDQRFDVVVPASAASLDRRRAAVEAVIGEIEAHGALVLAGLDGPLRYTASDARSVVESGELLGWWNVGLVVEPQLSEAVMHEYRLAEELAVREAGVRIEPVDASP